MSINKQSHIIKEIDELKIRVIEDKVSKERSEFLKKLLEHNGVEVYTEEIPPKTEEDNITYMVGTPDLMFNAIVKVYNRELRTFNGHHVTPDYWNQLTDEAEPNYWDREKKPWLNG